MGARILLLVTLSLSLAGLTSCEPAGNTSEKKRTFDRKYDLTARLIAGMKVPEYSDLSSLNANSRYVTYGNSINRGWKGFFGPNMETIRQWRKKHDRGSKYEKIFYPFSGPDVLHPLLFYPEAREIVMFGLEPTRGVPDVTGKKPEEVLPLLAGVKPAINFTLDHAFFVTRDMQKKVGRNSFSGITGIMMFFLARGGYRVLDVKQVHLDETGRLEHGEIRDKKKVRVQVPGVEIRFRRGRAGKILTARYFQLDIGDGSRRLPAFLAYLEEYAPFASIVKSASYLMHMDQFSRIRKAFLGHSRFLIQDDSGVPYSVLEKGDWNLYFYGKYHKPLPVFHYRYQADLKKAVEKNSLAPVPFVYGYGYGYPNMTYHLVMARKEKEDTTGQERK
jgi:hypothetical protein